MTVLPGPPKYRRMGSVRFRVFVLYALILLAAFSMFSAFVYAYFRHEAYQKVDALLDVRATGLNTAVKTYLTTRRADAPNGLVAFFSGYKNKEGEHFSAIADTLTAADLSTSKQQLRMAAHIFNLDGKLIAESGTFQAPPHLLPSILADVLKSGKQVRSFRLVNRDGRSIRVRVNTQTVMSENRARYIVQVLLPLKPVEEELARLRRVLIFLVVLMLLVTSWAGLYLVHVTLLPVDRIVGKIRDIRSDNLKERLYLKDTGDEINRLARTFNQMLERLEKSFDAQKQIVQDLSHELKTPLTILRGQLEVALKRPRSPEEYATLLQASVTEIENIRRIIDDLLMLARLDSSGGVLEMKNVDVRALLETLLEDVKILAQSKNISVAFEADGGGTVPANQIHLKRLFMNLLDNAVKYTQEGGKIRVVLKAEEKQIRIRVIDNGAGIDAAHLPNIFDRFYRGEKTQRGDSYGLGLSIVKSIVDTHQGKIEVRSEPGAETVFEIILPRKRSLQLFSPSFA